MQSRQSEKSNGCNGIPGMHDHFTFIDHDASPKERTIEYEGLELATLAADIQSVFLIHRVQMRRDLTITGIE